MAISQTLRSSRPARFWQSALLAVALIVVAHLALIAALQDDPRLLATAGNAFSLAETAGATLAMGLVAARTTRGREADHLAWGFLTLALLVTALGDSMWWLIQKIAGEVPFPSLADPLYLAFYPLFAAGLVLLPAMPHSPNQRVRLGLDFGSALLVGALLFWTFGIGPLVHGSNVSSAELAAALAYPIGDLALFSALLLLLSRRVSPSSQAALKLLASGVAVMLLTDWLFSSQAVTDTYVSGGFLDLGYTVSYLIFALAALRTQVPKAESAARVAAESRDGRTSVPVMGWSAVLPYAAVLFAFALLVWDHFYPTAVSFPLLVVVLGSIVVLMSVRGFLALSENVALRKEQEDLNGRLLRARDELEGRVKERTEALQRANAELGAEVGRHELAEEQLRASLREKEALLKEVHHRVKNNLQVVYSLLSLQSFASAEGPQREILREGQARIKAMALIHEKLYASPDLARVDFADYLRSLSKHLFATYQVNPAEVRLEVTAVEAWLSVDTAVPCGLIVNELVSNALRHAFTGRRKGTVTVTLVPAGHGKLQLSVTDDGVGLPGGFDMQQAPSLGLRLTEILTRQIGGDLRYECSDGTSFRITFTP